MDHFPSFLSCFLAIHFFLLNFLHKSVAFQSDTPIESSNHFHIVEVSSLLPACACGPSERASMEEGSLKLVHNHGPCSPRKHGKAKAPSARELLERDQARVSFMASRQLYGKNNIKVRWDRINREYVVNVGLGTPKRDLTLLMDTGSSLIWTQCRPCKLGSLPGCYKQRHRIFDPSKSCTYSNVTCPSQTCTLVNATFGLTTICDPSTCVYLTSYVDGSEAAGFLARERLSVGINTFNDIIFGCNVGNINNSLPGIDGIIGLGQDFLSFVEQTAKTYEKVFSYCLPSKSSEVGFLKFGKGKQVSKSLKFTQLGAGYAIELVGIKLGNTTIPISVKKGDASIDSGSSISALPSKDYNNLRDAYRKAMSQYPLAGPFDDDIDTCYHIGGHQMVQIPKMSFLFADGLVLDIPPIGVAFPYNSTFVCLPFTATPKRGGDIVLFGNMQQKTLEIVYDVAGGKLGFGYGGCK